MGRSAQPSTDLATNTELLAQLRTASGEVAWQRFSERYRPMLTAFARQAGLKSDAAEDVAQQTLLAFYEALRAGKYERDKGRLRSWLYGIARNTLRNWRREHGRDAAAANAAGQTEWLANVEDEDRLSKLWDAEWQQAVTRHCLELVRGEVSPETFLAFQLLVSREWPAARVAAHVGIGVGAVLGARQRVMRRLRDLAPRLREEW